MRANPNSPKRCRTVFSRTPLTIDLLTAEASREIRTMVLEGWAVTDAASAWHDWLVGVIGLSAERASVEIIGGSA